MLRLPRDVAARRVVDYCFVDAGITAFSGRLRTTLPTVLSAELPRIGRTLRCSVDVDALRALNREQWRQLERDLSI